MLLSQHDYRVNGISPTGYAARPIAGGGFKRTKQCSIVANGAEQQHYFGISRSTTNRPRAATLRGQRIDP